MIDVKEIKDLIKMIRRVTEPNIPYEEWFDKPMMEAVGDDRKGLEDMLSKMSIDELDVMCSSFDLFYDKWHDDEMLNMLDGYAEKLRDAGREGIW